MHLFQALFLDFQIQQLAIFKPVDLGKSYTLQKEALHVAKECSFEIGRISVMRAYEIKRVRADLYGSPCTKTK